MEIPTDQKIFLLPSPELEDLLLDKGLDLRELVSKSVSGVKMALADDPASTERGKKEPLTVLLGTAALIAALTPTLKELIRAATGRNPLITERRLVPVVDGKGKPIVDKNGEPILQWVDLTRAADPAQTITIKGYGITIQFGGN